MDNTSKDSSQIVNDKSLSPKKKINRYDIGFYIIVGFYYFICFLFVLQMVIDISQYIPFWGVVVLLLVSGYILVIIRKKSSEIIRLRTSYYIPIAVLAFIILFSFESGFFHNTKEYKQFEAKQKKEAALLAAQNNSQENVANTSSQQDNTSDTGDRQETQNDRTNQTNNVSPPPKKLTFEQQVKKKYRAEYGENIPYSMKEVDLTIKKLSKVNYITNITPENGTIYLKAEAWQALPVQNKKELISVFSTYMIYHSPMHSRIMTIKDAYTDQELGNWGVFGPEIKN